MKRSVTFLWSPTIARVRGIPITLHWSFLLFLLWIAFSGSSGLKSSLLEITFVLAIFTCVVLHELGHALTAGWFGIPTRSITLYPIGGVALLEKESRPKQDFFIALAGPLVNVVIALILLGFIPDIFNQEQFIDLSEHNFLLRLLIVNIVLVVFNMIPAYPMDGGRVLRATLACFLSQSTATIISARIGQVVSLGLGGLALYTGHTILLLIAIFVFFKARDEIYMWKAILARTNNTTIDII